MTTEFGGYPLDGSPLHEQQDLMELSGAKCYHMTWRPTSDWLILKLYSKVIQSNLNEVCTMSFCI